MNTIKLEFKDALKLDMERLGMSEATLGRALGIKQQAVHKWVSRNFPPISRLPELLTVLGPDSAVSKLSHEELFNPRSRTVAAPAAAPPAPSVARFHKPQSGDMLTARDKGLSAELEFFEALPHRLRVNVQRVIEVAGAPLRPDYISTNVVVELVTLFHDVATRNTSAAMLELMVAASTMPGAKMLLLVVQSEGAEDKRLPAITRVAAAHYGIEIARVNSGTEAARKICLLEGEPEAAEVVEPE